MAVLDLKTGQRKTLVRGGSEAEYVDPSEARQAGYLIYAAAGTLRAVRFDPVRLEVLGDPVTVVDHVMIKPTGAANYAVSRQGTLVYIAAGRERADDAARRSSGSIERDTKNRSERRCAPMARRASRPTGRAWRLKSTIRD